MDTTEENLVFVYGSLKRGGERDLFMWSDDGDMFIGEGTTQRAHFTLVDLGAFPAVTAGSDKHGWYRISGELWKVTKDTLADLDMIEGYPDFYTRNQTGVVVDGQSYYAWVYHIPNPFEFRLNLDSPNISVNGSVQSWKV